jgi:hypothetical protein
MRKEVYYLEGTLYQIDDACYGTVASTISGFPGEIHINNATGLAPNVGQRVMIIPVEEDYA